MNGNGMKIQVTLGWHCPRSMDAHDEIVVSGDGDRDEVEDEDGDRKRKKRLWAG
jgi:hypothetical protein